MASRILGMGDVPTLTEKAEAASEEEDREAMEARLRRGELTFDDFLASYRMMKKMGPLKGILSMVPGLGKELKGVEVDENELARVEAIILSMTPAERLSPEQRAAVEAIFARMNTAAKPLGVELIAREQAWMLPFGTTPPRRRRSPPQPPRSARCKGGCVPFT